MRFIVLLSLMLSFGLRAAPPDCRTDPQYAYTLQGNAGCMIRVGDQMLTVRHLRTGKLGLPGGKPKEQESAQCTAHRETWEETGIDVRVGRLLKNFNDNYYLFE